MPEYARVCQSMPEYEDYVDQPNLPNQTYQTKPNLNTPRSNIITSHTTCNKTSHSTPHQILITIRKYIQHATHHTTTNLNTPRSNIITSHTTCNKTSHST